jgi:hypothetical protein
MALMKVELSSSRLCECILFLCLLFLGFRNFDDADGWWHLKTGEQISTTGSIPQTDIYSATKGSATWVTHEWLTQTLMYALYQVGGFGLITVTFCMFSTVGFWIAYLRCPGRPFLAAIPLMVGVATAAPMLGARPQVISILLVSIFIAIQRRYIERLDTRALWMLIALMVLWVNSHGAFVLGPLLILLQMTGLILDHWFGFERSVPIPRTLRQLGLVFLASIAVIPLNPSGLKLLFYGVDTLSRRTEQLYLADWASPNFHLLRFQLFAVLILAGLILASLRRERIRPSECLLFGAFAFLGMQSVRHIPIFVIVAIPILVTHLHALLNEAGLLNADPDRARGSVSRVNLAILVLAVGLMGQRIVSMTKEETLAEQRLFPKAAVDFITQQNLKGPLFNLYEWGGYIIWRLHPEMKVYIDGRPEIYGDRYVQEYVDSYFGRRKWREPLERDHIQTVLIEPDAPLASLLRESEAWETAFEDNISVLFVRRAGVSETSSLN